MAYIVTGTNKKTGKREIISGIKNTKADADVLVKGLTFNNWKTLPKGISKRRAQELLSYKNIRIKKI